jgi:hypothetical protein
MPSTILVTIQSNRCAFVQPSDCLGNACVLLCVCGVLLAVLVGNRRAIKVLSIAAMCVVANARNCKRRILAALRN